MTTSGASDNEHIKIDEVRRELESPPQTDDNAAWEALEGDLWIPYRIRGSWRGGVLG